MTGYGELEVYFNDCLTIGQFSEMVNAICDVLDWDPSDEGSWPMWDTCSATWEEIPSDNWVEIRRVLRRYKGITATFYVYRTDDEE